MLVVARGLAPSMAACMTLKSMQALFLLWSLPFAVHRMALVMFLPTRFVMASTTPALVLITDWLTKFTQSASWCTSVKEVIGCPSTLYYQR